MQIMCENIDNLLERGEKIELLVDKTDKLSETAFKFEKSSRALKRSVYCNRIRTYLLVFVVIAVSNGIKIILNIHLFLFLNGRL